MYVSSGSVGAQRQSALSNANNDYASGGVGVSSGIGAAAQGENWETPALHGAITGGLVGNLSDGTYYSNPAKGVENLWKEASTGNFAGLRETALHVASTQVAGQVEAKLAKDMGIEPDQLNWLLMGASIFGDDVLPDHRYDPGGNSVNQPQVKGVLNRGILGAPFDAVDIMLEYQGLPDSTVRDVVENQVQGTNTPMLSSLNCHSLGTMTCSYIGWNIDGVSMNLAAVPLGVIAPTGMSGKAVNVSDGYGDAVNGFYLGKLFDWNATYIYVPFFVGTARMAANAVYSAREANYDGQIRQKLNQARDAESEGDMTTGQTLRWDAFNLQQQRDNPTLSPVLVGAGTALAGSLLGGSPNLGYLAQSTSLDYIGNAWTNAGKGFNQAQAVQVACAPAEAACQGGKGGFALNTHASLADQIKQLQDHGYTLTLLDAIPGPSGDGSGTILATNGILNNLPRAAQVMLGNVATSAGQRNTTFYLQYNQTYGAVSDLFQTGWDKFIAPMYGEYSATTNALANAIWQYPNSAAIGNVGLYGHSWGSITTRNVENILANSGYKNTGMSVAVFGPAVSPGSVVDPLKVITGKRVDGKDGLAKLKQVSYFSRYDDPVAAYIGGTISISNSPYLAPGSGAYLQGASRESAWQALLGLGPVLRGSINPHSCYNFNCLGTSQNWTSQDAKNYGLKYQSQDSRMRPQASPSPEEPRVSRGKQ